MEKASSLFENLYKCIRQTALSDPYKAADETYYKILVPEKNSKGKGFLRIYRVVMSINTRMIYLLYMMTAPALKKLFLTIRRLQRYHTKRRILTLPGSSKAILIPYHTHSVPATYKTEIYGCGENWRDAKRICGDDKHFIKMNISIRSGLTDGR